MDPTGLWPPFVERHPEAAGKGTHALVIGVSAYDNLPPPGGKPEEPWRLVQLESAATAALNFAEWLNESYSSGEGAPLQSLRVLLSPADTEREWLAARIGGAPPATTMNALGALTAWGNELIAHTGSTSVVYLAGHGVSAGREQRNLLLQDLPAALLLTTSVDVTSVLASLTHYRLDASYAFVDTCSDFLAPDREYGGGGLGLGHTFQHSDSRRGDHRFYASTRGAAAYGRLKIGSKFGCRLRKALREEVTRTPDGTWAVTPQKLAARFAKHTAEQWFWPQLAGAEPLRFQLPERRPMGTIKVTMTPPAGAGKYTLGVLDGDEHPEFPPVAFEPHPYLQIVEPGTHIVQVTYGTHEQQKERTVEVYREREYPFKDRTP